MADSDDNWSHLDECWLSRDFSRIVLRGSRIVEVGRDLALGVLRLRFDASTNLPALVDAVLSLADTVRMSFFALNADAGTGSTSSTSSTSHSPHTAIHLTALVEHSPSGLFIEVCLILI